MKPAGVRGQLAVLVAVTTSLVLLAFLIPLGLVLRNSAADRAIGLATDAAQSTAALIALNPDSAPGVDGNVSDGLTVTVFLANGTTYGAAAARTPSIELASRGRAFTAANGSGVEVLAPVQGMPGGAAVVRAYADESLLYRGVARAWSILAGLGVALFALGLLLADRLGRRMRHGVTDLAGVADRLAAGDLDARVAPSGPREIRRVGAELNRLAARIRELLAAEREEAADLAHRLRTPMTSLRLDIDSINDPAQRDRLSRGLDNLSRGIDEVIRTARRPVREGVGAPIDLASIARLRAEFWTPLAEDDGRTLDVDAPDKPVLARGSAEDVAVALDALLQNVFAHSPAGSSMVVRVTSDRALTVTDDGPGFDPAVITRGVSSGTSTGLGLDIARRTAEAGGGSMEIAGSSVTLRFGAP